MKTPLRCLMLMFAAALHTCAMAGVAEEPALLAAGRALYLGAATLQNGAVVQGVHIGSGACVQCHGTRGQERVEAGITVPSIQWNALTQASRAGAGYRQASQLLNALRQGSGRDGRALRAPMPTFDLTAHEQQALLAYLRVLGTDAQPVAGVTPERVVVATVLPADPATASKVRNALVARVQRVNAQGGVFGRTLEVRFFGGKGDAATPWNEAREMLSSGEVFAFVASNLPDPPPDMLAAMRQHEVPLVATLGMPMQESTDRRLTYMVPSLMQQLRDVDGELRRRCVPPSGSSLPTLWLYPLRSALAAPLVVRDDPGVQAVPVTDAADLLHKLATLPAQRVLLLIGPEQARQAREQLARRTPSSPVVCVGTLAALSAVAAPSTLYSIPEVLGTPVSADALLSGDVRAQGLWPVLADAAMQVFIEALARSGRQLDASALLTALESMHRHPVATGMEVSFTPQRHHGLASSFIWKEANHVSTTIEQ